MTDNKCSEINPDLKSLYVNAGYDELYGECKGGKDCKCMTYDQMVYYGFITKDGKEKNINDPKGTEKRNMILELNQKAKKQEDDFMNITSDRSNLKYIKTTTDISLEWSPVSIVVCKPLQTNITVKLPNTKNFSTFQGYEVDRNGNFKEGKIRVVNLGERNVNVVVNDDRFSIYNQRNVNCFKDYTLEIGESADFCKYENYWIVS